MSEDIITLQNSQNIWADAKNNKNIEKIMLYNAARTSLMAVYPALWLEISTL